MQTFESILKYVDDASQKELCETLCSCKSREFETLIMRLSLVTAFKALQGCIGILPDSRLDRLHQRYNRLRYHWEQSLMKGGWWYGDNPSHESLLVAVKEKNKPLADKQSDFILYQPGS